MTDDYKQSLIDYVTGLLKIEQPRPTEFDPEELAISGNMRDYSANWWSEPITALSGKNVCVNGILESDFSDISIMYGGYQNGDTGNSKGFLIYLDEYSRPIRTVLLNSRGIHILKYDDDSNRVYGITGDRANYPVADDNDTYFTYFDNLFMYAEEGTPQQTYSYRIWQNSGDGYFFVRDIVKHPNNSWYLMYVTQFTNTTHVKVIELQINVGQSNQITTWNLTDSYYSYGYYGWYNGDTPHFRVISYDNTNEQFKLAQDNGSNVSYTTLTIDTVQNKPQTSYTKSDYLAVNEDEIYFVYNANWTENSINKKQCCLYKFSGSNIQTMYKTQVEQYANPYYNIPMMNIVRDSNSIYILRYLPDEENSQTTVSVANLNTLDWETITETGYVYRVNMYNQRASLKRRFNILYFSSFTGYLRTSLGSSTGNLTGFAGQEGEISQVTGYTGYPYSDYNVLVPRYCNLHYVSLVVMFSRNFYNVTKFENTTTSSVEIPANYLNNITITRPEMFGITSYKLVDKYPYSFTKNKYETIHLNFINTINVIDEDTDILYPASAIKVNQSSSTGGQTRYDNTKCLKYRINYNDNTVKKEPISWSDINNFNKKTNFTIYCDKEIDSIDLISNDESVIYLRINGNFIVGKYYTIKQKVRIGERPQGQDLMYNGENVLYNNEQVEVYV